MLLLAKIMKPKVNENISVMFLPKISESPLTFPRSDLRNFVLPDVVILHADFNLLIIVTFEKTFL